jgi:Overcoming lysogenization defect protein-like, TOPRIM domain
MPAELRSGPGAVVLVEGFSDRCALEALAARGGRDLNREGISIAPMGGATNIGHFLDAFGPRAEAADRPRVPRPLERLLAYV